MGLAHSAAVQAFLLTFFRSFSHPFVENPTAVPGRGGAVEEQAAATVGNPVVFAGVAAVAAVEVAGGLVRRARPQKMRPKATVEQ
jgi:hypothetical protein